MKRFTGTSKKGNLEQALEQAIKAARNDLLGSQQTFCRGATAGQAPATRYRLARPRLPINSITLALRRQ